MRDVNGNQIGREFLVERKDFEKPIWVPFENLMHCKKALKSFYNKHPELPFPNCLAQNDDEEFEPSSKKNAPKKGQKQEQEVMDERKRGYPKQLSQSPYKEPEMIMPEPSLPINQSKSSQKGIKASLAPQYKPPSSGIVVKGLFADPNTNEIFYQILTNGKSSYQNRKWVMLNCKQELIDFYESCIKVKEK